MISSWKSLIIVTLTVVRGFCGYQQFKPRYKNDADIKYEFGFLHLNHEAKNGEKRLKELMPKFQEGRSAHCGEHQSLYEKLTSPLNYRPSSQNCGRHSLCKRDYNIQFQHPDTQNLADNSLQAFSRPQRTKTSRKYKIKRSARFPRQDLKEIHEAGLGTAQNSPLLLLSLPVSPTNTSAANIEETPGINLLSSLLANDILKCSSFITSNSKVPGTNKKNGHEKDTKPSTLNKNVEKQANIVGMPSTVLYSGKDENIGSDSLKNSKIIINKDLKDVKMLKCMKESPKGTPGCSQYTQMCPTQGCATAPQTAKFSPNSSPVPHDSCCCSDPMWCPTHPPYCSMEYPATSCPHCPVSYKKLSTLPWVLNKMEGVNHRESPGCCPRYYRPTIHTTGKNPCCHARRNLFGGLATPPHPFCTCHYTTQFPLHIDCGATCMCDLTTTTTPTTTTTAPTTTPCKPTILTTCIPVTTGRQMDDSPESLFVTPPTGSKIVACTDPNCMHNNKKPNGLATTIVIYPPRGSRDQTVYPVNPSNPTTEQNMDVPTLLQSEFEDTSMARNTNGPTGNAGKNNVMGKVLSPFSQSFNQGKNLLKKGQNGVVCLRSSYEGSDEAGLDRASGEITWGTKYLAPLEQLNALIHKRQSQMNGGERHLSKKDALDSIKKVQEQLKAIESEICSTHPPDPLKSNLTLQIKVYVDIMNNTYSHGEYTTCHN